jgi:hypothetical protein
MSNPLHLSASARRILALERELEVYRRMQIEYNALMNYIVVYHHTNDMTDDNLEHGDFVPEFEIISGKLKKLDFRPIKSEIVDHGKRMVLTRLEASDSNSQPIILPAAR